MKINEEEKIQIFTQLTKLGTNSDNNQVILKEIKEELKGFRNDLKQIETRTRALENNTAVEKERTRFNSKFIFETVRYVLIFALGLLTSSLM